MTAIASAEASSSQTTITYRYAFSEFDLEEPAAAVFRIMAFFWPLAFVIYRARSARQGHRVLATAEALLLAGSAFIVFAVSYIGDRAIGAYLAWVALAIYAMAWLRDFGAGIRALRFRAAYSAEVRADAVAPE